MRNKFTLFLVLMLPIIGLSAKTIEFDYSDREVYALKLNYGLATTINFKRSERPVSFALGDASAWQVSKVGHAVTLKPISKTPKTNLTIWTNKHTYLFDLDAYDLNTTVESGAQSPIHLVRFNYPEAANKNTVSPAVFKPQCLNSNYSRYGNKDIAPSYVCDDGTFTYLKYDKNQELPAAFLVNENQEESILNMRQIGNYQVIERLGKQFTLRLGEQVATVFNEEAK